MSYHKISLFDLDHTLFKCNISLEYYLFLLKKKRLPLSTIPNSIFYYFKHRYLDLPLSEIHQLAFNLFLSSRSHDLFIQYIDEFIEYLMPQMVYLPTYIELKRALHLGHFTAILTSSPAFLAKPLGEVLGVHEVYASEYEVNPDGIFSSILKVIEGNEKAKIVLQMQENFKVGPDQMTSYSDSYHDLAFLESTGEKIAVNPDKRLKSVSIEKNWKII